MNKYPIKNGYSLTYVSNNLESPSVLQLPIVCRYTAAVPYDLFLIQFPLTFSEAISLSDLLIAILHPMHFMHSLLLYNFTCRLSRTIPFPVLFFIDYKLCFEKAPIIEMGKT